MLRKFDVMSHTARVKPAQQRQLSLYMPGAEAVRWFAKPCVDTAWACITDRTQCTHAPQAIITHALSPGTPG